MKKLLFFYVVILPVLTTYSNNITDHKSESSTKYMQQHSVFSQDVNIKYYDDIIKSTWIDLIFCGGAINPKNMLSLNEEIPSFQNFVKSDLTLDKVVMSDNNYDNDHIL